MEETCSFRSGHPTSLEDEIALLALQLEEIEVFSEGGKGKYPANRPPDSNVAYEAFRTELEEYQAFLADQQMARSIAAAVFSDGVTIAELAAEEIQSHEDRVLALQMDNEESGPPLYSESIFQEPTGRVLEWVSAATESQYAGTVVDFSDDEKQGGPSTSYAERQGDVMEKLRKQSKCAAYLDFFYSGQTILLPCNDRYCINCLKGLFLRAMKDEELFPVRCHKQYIPLELISKHLSSEELAAFELASIEFTTVNRVYCFNRDCGQFIRPSQIAPGSHRALCEKCGRLTCALCKNDYHLGIDCPDDPALQETRELAGEMGWQPCHRCGSIVMLRSGCNHMTCVSPQLKSDTMIVASRLALLTNLHTGAVAKPSSVMSVAWSGKIAIATMQIQEGS
jgi:hypothetical protein